MTTLVLDAVSRWFGNVVAVNDITMRIGPGVTGLLGPNGAGKSTLIHMMGGFLPPSAGTVTLDGDVVWRNEQVYRRIGLVPEREAMYDAMTGWQFVLANARLHRLPDPEAAWRPATTTWTSVAICSTSSRMWELNSTVRPCWPISRSRSMSCSRWRGSMPLNGSSSRSTSGSCTIAVAILIRCRIPLE